MQLAVCLYAQIISRTPIVWCFIEYQRQDVSGKNVYVCFGTIIWIWTPIAHGFALPIGMVVKSAVELIYHLSFLGVKKTWTTNSIQVRGNFEFKGQKKSTDISCSETDGEADSVNEVPVEQIHVDTQSNSVSPTLSFCDAETQTEITGEFLNRLEFELKSTSEENDKLAKEKDELTRDSKRHALKNCTEKSEVWQFQNLRKKMKISNFTLAFYTGMHSCFFTTCYMTRPRTWNEYIWRVYFDFDET